MEKLEEKSFKTLKELWPFLRSRVVLHTLARRTHRTRQKWTYLARHNLLLTQSETEYLCAALDEHISEIEMLKRKIRKLPKK